MNKRRSPRAAISEQVIVSSFSARAEDHQLISHLASKAGLNRSMLIVEAIQHYAKSKGITHAKTT